MTSEEKVSEILDWVQDALNANWGFMCCLKEDLKDLIVIAQAEHVAVRMETIEAEPVRHGIWLKNDLGQTYCSICKRQIPTVPQLYIEYGDFEEDTEIDETEYCPTAAQSWTEVNKMAYKPILFNTDMVRAILAGRKTQTRRLCKGHGECSPVQCGYHPPFKPGDILYVREAWCDPNPENPLTPLTYKADFPMHWDADQTEHGDPITITAEEMKWKPSIHMPKEAARIFLRVKNVRAERLQDIKNYECVDEGVIKKPNITKRGDLVLHNRYRNEFAQFWDTTIKPADRERYGWNANPWVWVIEFERCGKPDGGASNGK